MDLRVLYFMVHFINFVLYFSIDGRIAALDELSFNLTSIAYFLWILLRFSDCEPFQDQIQIVSSKSHFELTRLQLSTLS